MLITQLVPERVELRVMVTVNDVAKLMEHGVQDALKGKKQTLIARVS